MKCDKLRAVLSVAALLASAMTAIAQEPAKPATAEPQVKQPQVKQEQAKPADVERITVEELKSKIEKKEPVTIIDARSKDSYSSSDKKIKGAVRMTSEDVKERSKAIPRDREIVIYCA